MMRDSLHAKLHPKELEKIRECSGVDVMGEATALFNRLVRGSTADPHFMANLAKVTNRGFCSMDELPVRPSIKGNMMSHHVSSCLILIPACVAGSSRHHTKSCARSHSQQRPVPSPAPFERCHDALWKIWCFNTEKLTWTLS